MAALALAVGLGAGLQRPAHAGGEADAYKVRLVLRIAGLGRNGCDVDIKPVPGCKFRTETLHVGPTGEAERVLVDVSTDSADRQFAFAITIREPGQRARTLKRGFRLSDPKIAKSSSFTCYLPSPSRIASVDGARERK
jgi:hypothetical protein